MMNCPPGKGYFALLRTNHDYTWLWLGATISLLGDHVIQVASILLALSITEGSGLSVGLVVGLKSVLKVFGANAGGIIADRYDRRLSLIAISLVTASATTLYVPAGRSSSLCLLYLLTALMGGLNALSMTVRTSFMPDLVGKSSLTRAFGLSHMSTGIALVAGNFLGGAIVGFCGFEAAFLVGAVTSVAVAGLTWKVRAARTTFHPDDLGAHRDILSPSRVHMIGKDVLGGARYLAGHPLLLKMVGLDLAWTMGGGGVFVIMAVLNRERLGDSGQVLGVLYALAGIGALLATLARPWIGRCTRRDMRLLGISCILEGFFFSVLVLLSDRIAVSFLFVLQMTSSFVFGLVFGPVLIGAIDDQMRGRVIGFENGIVLAAYGLSSILYGVLLNHMDVTWIGLASGGIMVLSGVAWLVAMGRRLV